MKFANFVGPSYTAKSVNVADEECINLYAETNETTGAQAQRSYLWTPGLKVFVAFPQSPVRGSYNTGDRVFAVYADQLVELASDGTYVPRGTVANDGKAVSIYASAIELFIVSGGSAYSFVLATNVLTDVTSLLAGIPLMGGYGDGYFAVMFVDSNKFQTSAILDGTTWPGIQVNEVSVFPENIRSLIFNHRELWIMGERHIQPYQDTGSDEIYDPPQGTLIEKGCGATFAPERADNSIFWVDEDERGARTCWRAEGYTPQRSSTHAVETALSSYASIADLVSYAYQDSGHLFWQLYIPNTDCSWVFDVGENLWHKRAEWNETTGTFGPQASWNHVYAFGKHLVGDWQTGNLWELTQDALDDDGSVIRRVRRAPTINNELQRMFFSELRVDFDTGLGPQPPLEDGAGNPRPPRAMLHWSDDGGHTWSNEHWIDCGFAGQYGVFARWKRLGYARRRVFEVIMTDRIPWSITDASLDVTQ